MASSAIAASGMDTVWFPTRPRRSTFSLIPRTQTVASAVVGCGNSLPAASPDPQADDIAAMLILRSRESFGRAIVRIDTGRNGGRPSVEGVSHFDVLGEALVER
jgi:hypothetical protein